MTMCRDAYCQEDADPDTARFCGRCRNCWALRVTEEDKVKLLAAYNPEKKAGTCSSCGSTRVRRFCANCGRPKLPEGFPFWVPESRKPLWQVHPVIRAVSWLWNLGRDPNHARPTTPSGRR